MIRVLSFSLFALTLAMEAAETPVASPSATAEVAPLSPAQAEATRKVIADLVEERLKFAKEADLAIAGEIADLATASGLKAEDVASPVADVPHLALFKPLLVTVGNPHLDALVAKVKGELAKPDVPWKRVTLTTSPFNDLGGAYGLRTNGHRLREYLWCYAHPASPLRGDPEVLRRLLRRAHAFIDAYAFNALPGSTPKTERTDLDDQFTLESAISALREIRQVYPNLLLPKQREFWDATFVQISERLWKTMGKAKAWNLNIETARMVAVLNLAYLANDQERIDRVRQHIDLVLPKMYADGAWPYNGGSNPAVNYHNELLYSLVRLYDLTGYEPIAEALKASQWKGPVMGRTDEFWTSPFHKTYRWNYERGTEAGPEAVVTLSGNGYTRTLTDFDKVIGSRDDLAWYQKDIKPLALPDHYTIPDRNVGGPRAWYGRFNYAGTFRSPPYKEAGHETLMGAMTVDADGRLNSILTDISPRVHLRQDDVRDPKDNTKIDDTAWGRLTASLQGVFVTGRHFSASAAVHDITTVRKSAYQGTFTGWKARQMWLGLSDRIIGVVSMVPGEPDLKAYEVDAVLRFISGGSAGAAVPKKLETIAPHHYRYGELDLIVHDSNFAAVELREIPYRQPKYPATEVTFRARSGPVPAEPHTFPGDTVLTVTLEVRPTWATGEATVSTSVVGHIIGLDATLAGKHYQQRFNAGLDDAEVTWLTAPAPASLRVVSANGSSTLTRQIPAHTTLAGGQEAVVISSPDEQDHLPGWASFQDMVETKKP